MTIVNKLRITSSVEIDDVILRHIAWVKADLKAYPNIEVIWIKRKKQTIKQLFKTSNVPLIVIEHQGPKLYFSAEDKLFYHENTSKLKLKNFESTNQLPILLQCIGKNKTDVFTFVDGTVGLGNDLSLVANYYVHAKFIAIEANIYIHLIIKWGIYFFNPSLYERIQFYHGSIDTMNLKIFESEVIYIDPFYEHTIETSNINTLVKHVKDSNDLTTTDALTAYIVKHLKHQFILRNHYQSQLFKKYPFTMHIQKRSKSHYGVLKNKSARL